uniref:AA9 family lytic polysaccharide monooxygenase n=1 Tax=Moniliophthora roreri TaxID=221103 RepID=A0A0W0F2F7_MONRR
MLTQLIALTLLAVPQALAHGGVVAISNGGNWYNGWQPYNSPTGQSSIIRPWATYDPILDAKASTIHCNDDGTSPSGQLTATVVAGSEITAYWNQVWPHAQGPMLVYLAQCPGSTCTSVNTASLKWFKIDQSGLISGTIGNGYWGSGKMIDQNSSWTTTIPSTVPSGSYMIRFETIALHSLPAQFYPECAQLQITGGGNLAPSSNQLVSFPGAYSNSDPGLSVNIYTQEAMNDSNYIIPGPPLYGSKSGSTPSNPGTTAQPGTTAGTTAAPTSQPTSGTGTVAQYGQCGGTGWTGPTGCVAPYTCHVVNPYYSQCL